MATSGFFSSISHPSPQPCDPFHARKASIESMEDESEQHCHTFINHEDQYPTSYESEEENNTSADDADEGDHESESPKILRRFREKLDEQGHVMYKKLRFKFRRNGTIERKFEATLHHFKGDTVSDLFEKSSRSDSEASNDHTNTERGIDIGYILSSNQGGIDEPNKLERFKVKAVNIVGVGVVKEENY